MEVVGNDLWSTLNQFGRTLMLRYRLSNSAGTPIAANPKPTDLDIITTARATASLTPDAPTPPLRPLRVGIIGDSLIWISFTEITEALKAQEPALAKRGHQLSLLSKPIPLQGTDELRNDAEAYGKWAQDTDLKVLVVAMGGNDILFQKSPEDIHRNLYESIKIIQAKSPNTRIVINGFTAECMRRGAERKMDIHRESKAALAEWNQMVEAYPETALFVTPPPAPIPLPGEDYVPQIETMYKRLYERLKSEPGGDKIDFRPNYLNMVDKDQYYQHPEGWSGYWKAYIDLDAWKDWTIRLSEGYSRNYTVEKNGVTLNTAHPNGEGQKKLAEAMAEFLSGPISKAGEEEAYVAVRPPILPCVKPSTGCRVP